MKLDIMFYFTYDNNDEFKYHLDILCEVFGDEILQNLKDNTSERIASVRLCSINETHLFNLLANYDDDELRILMIADELIIGTDRVLNDMGL